MTVTFEVSPVERAAMPLAELNGPKHHAATRLLLGKPVEAWGSNASPWLATHRHGFVQTVRTAFEQHCPLVLTPDTIWLCIAQGVAAHINANAERLRGKFVRHSGRAVLNVRRDDFIKGSAENPWPEVFQSFSDQIAEHISRQRELLVCDFSTTGPFERAASEIVLMDAMREYFDYRVLTLCGIPAVTLEGTVDDWRAIRRRVQALGEYELEWWVAALSPVIDQFIAAAEGHPDIAFWHSLFKLNSMSGTPDVTGWISVFFPYDMGSRPSDAIMRWTTHAEEGPFLGSFMQDELPSGLAVVPFTWTHLAEDYPMEFLGGFVGTAQDERTLALRPAIGWAVRDSSLPSEATVARRDLRSS